MIGGATDNCKQRIHCVVCVRARICIDCEYDVPSDKASSGRARLRLKDPYSVFELIVTWLVFTFADSTGSFKQVEENFWTLKQIIVYWIEGNERCKKKSGHADWRGSNRISFENSVKSFAHNRSQPVFCTSLIPVFTILPILFMLLTCFINKFALNTCMFYCYSRCSVSKQAYSLKPIVMPKDSPGWRGANPNLDVYMTTQLLFCFVQKRHRQTICSNLLC